MSSIASAVLMVAPTSFGFDGETAVTNSFQQQLDLDGDVVRARAMAEFDACVNALRLAGVNVLSFEYGPEVVIPNAVFPNNWLSTWPDGRVFLYSMATQSRRIERSGAVVDQLRKKFDVQDVVDLSFTESDGRFLESTGVMVFDHANKVAYGCVSPRCDRELFESHAFDLGYRAVVFDAHGDDGAPIYHTNVMMGIQDATAVICAEAITDPAMRSHVLGALRESGHTVIEISREQMSDYCGNIIQLQGTDGKSVLLLSQSALASFAPDQRTQLERGNTLVPVAIPTIQAVGGGSVRCMVAEIFLPDLAQRAGSLLAE